MSQPHSQPTRHPILLQDVQLPDWALGDNDAAWDISRMQMSPLLQADASGGGKDRPVVDLSSVLEKINFYLVLNIYSKGSLEVERDSPKWKFIVTAKAISLRIEEGWVLPGEDRFEGHIISEIFADAVEQAVRPLGNFDSAVNLKNSLLKRPNMPNEHLEKLILKIGNPFVIPIIKAHPEAEQHAREYIKTIAQKIKPLPRLNLDRCVEKLVWTDLQTLVSLKGRITESVFYEALLNPDGAYRDVEKSGSAQLDERSVAWICQNLRDNHLQAVDCFIRWGEFNTLITPEFESAFIRAVEESNRNSNSGMSASSVTLSFETQVFLPLCGNDARAVLVDSLMNPNRASLGFSEGSRFNGRIETACHTYPVLSEAVRIGLMMRSYYPNARGATPELVAELAKIEPDFFASVKQASDRTALLALMLPDELVEGAKLVFSGFPPEDARMVHSLIYSQDSAPISSKQSGPDDFEFELSL